LERIFQRVIKVSSTKNGVEALNGYWHMSTLFCVTVPFFDILCFNLFPLFSHSCQIFFSWMSLCLSPASM